MSRDHTPMAVTIFLSGDMSFCAYSGCWQGSATDILATGQYLTVTGARLRWTGTGAASGESIAGSATVDRKNRTATVMIAGFAHPMTCERNPASG
ncbi:MAG TPA: hypothetical protein VKN63_03910 [Afifellaceae bacterium]|nr:hypothetical protein [Afifellaceae bacterium]